MDGPVFKGISGVDEEIEKAEEAIWNTAWEYFLDPNIDSQQLAIAMMARFKRAYDEAAGSQ